MLSSPAPPRRRRRGHGVSQVSWLKAAELAFPDHGGSSGWMQSAFRGDLGPFTVAGPRRIHTGFRDDSPVMTFCSNIFGPVFSGVNGEPQGNCGLSRESGGSAAQAPDPIQSRVPSLTKRTGSRRLEEKRTEPTRLWLESPAGRWGFFPGYCPCYLPCPAWGNGSWSPWDT